MDSMNSFADLQALQQPSLGQALTMQPQQQPQQPQQPAQGPPATPEEYGQRVQGWTDTLSEMLANPMVSVALLQMGAALSAGRSAPEAMADTAGAVGRAGALTDQYRRRQEGDEMLRRKAGLEERKFGLEEREFGAREKLLEAQTANYQRMARGGGGGGSGGKANTAAATARWEELYQWRLSKNGGDKEEAAAFADSSTFGNSKLPKAEPGLTPTLLLQEAERRNTEAVRLFEMGDTKGAAAERAEAQRLRQQAGISAGPAGGPSGVMDPKSEAEAHLRRMEKADFGAGGKASAPPAARAPNPALGGVTPTLEKRATQTAPYHPRQILEAARNGTMDTWAKQGWDVKQDILGALSTNVLGAKEAQELRRYLEKY